MLLDLESNSLSDGEVVYRSWDFLMDLRFFLEIIFSIFGLTVLLGLLDLIIFSIFGLTEFFLDLWISSYFNIWTYRSSWTYGSHHIFNIWTYRSSWTYGSHHISYLDLQIFLDLWISSYFSIGLTDLLGLMELIIFSIFGLTVLLLWISSYFWDLQIFLTFWISSYFQYLDLQTYLWISSYFSY